MSDDKDGSQRKREKSKNRRRLDKRKTGNHAWSIDENHRSKREHLETKCVHHKNPAILEVLSSTAWQRICSSAAYQKTLKEDVTNLLRPTAYIRIEDTTISSDSEITTLWTCFTDNNSNFIAEVILSGLRWRLEGLVHDIEAGDNDIAKFVLDDGILFREFDPSVESRVAEWIRVPSSYLGVDLRTSVKCEMKLKIDQSL